MMRLPTVLLCAVLVSACIQPEPPVAKAPDPLDTEAAGFPPVPDGSVRFLVIGDYGNGDAEQDALAQGMLTACRARGCQFAITVGDNIYPSGVRSPYDPQFDAKFETPFRDVPLPFYLSLGNHDNGNGEGSNPHVGDHQVAYTDVSPSGKWRMPARNHALRVGDVELFAIDSGPQEVSQTILWPEGTRGHEVQAWLRGALSASDAPWKFVYAHHPYLSNGLHGNAGIYDSQPGRGLQYKLMLEEEVCGTADVFFAGHDHDLQWLEPGLQCPGTELIISGGGGHVRAKGAVPDNPAYWEGYDTHGFLWVDITGDTFTGAFIGFDGSVLYERSFDRLA